MISIATLHKNQLAFSADADGAWCGLNESSPLALHASPIGNLGGIIGNPLNERCEHSYNSTMQKSEREQDPGREI